MKKINYFLIILLIITSISCQKDNSEIFDYSILKRNSIPKSQTFKIGLTKDTIIIGDKGTKVFFKRENYKLSVTDSITIILKELYDFPSIIFNQMSTITDKNELLETSGMFYLEITTDGETVDLLTGKNIEIGLPLKKFEDNYIFIAEIDSLERFEWKKEEVKAKVTYPDTLKNKLARISDGFYFERNVPLDSIDYYQNITEIWNNQRDDIIKDNYSESTFKLLLNDYGWYNIDKFVDDVSVRINFTVDINNGKTNWYNSYIVYDGINSVISNYHYKLPLKFDSIPFRNNMRLILTNEKDSIIYFDKIDVNLNNKHYKVHLSEVNLTELKQQLIK